MRIFLYIFIIIFFLVDVYAREPLLADIMNKDINITASFDGAKIMVYGAIDPRLYKDTVIVISIIGPSSHIKIRKKKRYFGIWMVSEDNMELLNAPGYYAVSSSNKKLDNIEVDFLKKYQIGWENLKINMGNNISSEEEKEGYRKLLRLFYENRYLLLTERANIEILGDSLFRAEFDLPAVTPVGLYKINTFLISKKGNLISSWSNNIKVSKGGIAEDLYDYSKNHSFLYGLFAALGAIFLGFIASEVFRRI